MGSVTSCFYVGVKKKKKGCVLYDNIGAKYPLGTLLETARLKEITDASKMRWDSIKVLDVYLYI